MPAELPGCVCTKHTHSKGTARRRRSAVVRGCTGWPSEILRPLWFGLSVLSMGTATPAMGASAAASATAEGSKKRRYARHQPGGGAQSSQRTAASAAHTAGDTISMPFRSIGLDAGVAIEDGNGANELDRCAAMDSRARQDGSCDAQRQRHLHAVDVNLWQEFWVPSAGSFFGGVYRGQHGSLVSSSSSSSSSSSMSPSYASSSSLSCFDAPVSSSSSRTSATASTETESGGKYQTQPLCSRSEAALSESTNTASWVDGQQQRMRDRRKKSLTHSNMCIPEQSAPRLQPAATSPPTIHSPSSLSSSSCSLQSNSSSPMASRKRSLSPVSTDTLPTSDASEGEDASTSSKNSSPSTSPTSSRFIARLKSRDERRHQQHMGKLYTQAIAAGRGIASQPPTVVGQTTTPFSKRTFDAPYVLSARLKKRKVSHKIRSFLLLRPPGLPLIGTDGAADIAHIRTAPAWLKNATSELSRESRMSPSEYLWSSNEADQTKWAVSVLEGELRTRLRIDADVGAGQARNVDNTVCIQANAGPTVSLDGIVHIAYMSQPILPPHIAGLAFTTAANIPLSSPPAEELAFPPVLVSPQRTRATQSLSPPSSPTALNRSGSDESRKRQSSLPPPASAVFNHCSTSSNHQNPSRPLFGPFQLPPQDVPQSVLKAQLMAILRSRLGEAHRAAAAPLKMKKFAIWNACHKRAVIVSPKSSPRSVTQGPTASPAATESTRIKANDTSFARDATADSAMESDASSSALGLTDMGNILPPVRSLSSAFSRPKSPTHQRIEQVYTLNAQPDASLTPDAQMCIDASELLRSPRPTATEISAPPSLMLCDVTPERPPTPFVQVSPAAPRRPKLVRSVSSPTSSPPVVHTSMKVRSPSQGHQPLMQRQRPTFTSMAVAHQLMSPPQHHAEAITVPA